MVANPPVRDVSRLGRILRREIPELSFLLSRRRRGGTHVYYGIRDPRLADLINRALDLLAQDASETRAIHKAIELVRLRA